MAADQSPDYYRSTQSMTAEELAPAQNVKPMTSTDDWAADIFATDEELEAFLTNMRESLDRRVA